MSSADDALTLVRSSLAADIRASLQVGRELDHFDDDAGEFDHQSSPAKVGHLERQLVEVGRSLTEHPTSAAGPDCRRRRGDQILCSVRGRTVASAGVKAVCRGPSRTNRAELVSLPLTPGKSARHHIGVRDDPTSCATPRPLS